MIHLTSHELAKLLDAPISNLPEIAVTGISIDTRSLIPGNLFVAIKGESLDGHDFVAQAYNKGAACALVTHSINCAIPQIVVADTTLALGKIANHWRMRFNLPMIAITGSNGKTTTKNMVAAILRAHAEPHPETVLSTSGNLNNHLGMPLTLAKLNHTHRYAVIEMGMNHFGEIDYLTHLAQPTIAIITNAGAAHLAGVGHTIAGVAKAKAEIFNGVQPNGVAILNRDDDFYEYWQEAAHHLKQLSFGLHEKADIRAEIALSRGIQHLTVTTPSGREEIALPLLGEHNARNALAAIAACLAANIPLAAMKKGLATLKPEKGRLCLSTLPSGTRLIDDTYNANPASFSAAIITLAKFQTPTLLVMGDMKELGEDAKNWHHLIGETAKTAGITKLFTYGELSQEASLAFGPNARHFTERDALCAAVKQNCAENTTILVKGSRSMQMETVVHYLID